MYGYSKPETTESAQNIGKVKDVIMMNKRIQQFSFNVLLTVHHDISVTVNRDISVTVHRDISVQ
jgi:hypothetical protein